MAGQDLVSPRVRCERARQWASLRLDDELSALEVVLLERHLGSCQGCREFEARIRTAAGVLRDAPVEVAGQSFQVPRRRLLRLPKQGRRTALVAAAALALGALAGSLLERPSAPVPEAPAPEFSFLSRDVGQLRELPRGQRQPAPAPTPSGPPNPPEGVI
jgi:predicted anti-sigma-YlaC factor YlaD